MVIIVIEMVWGFGIETGNRIRIFNVIGDGNGDRDLPSSFFSGSGKLFLRPIAPNKQLTDQIVCRLYGIQN